MKHRKKLSGLLARAAMAAFSLLLTAILCAVPVFAESAADSTTAPFYFTPIGMMAILILLALCVVGIVALVRSSRRQHPDSEPTVIPLEPKLPKDSQAPGSFAEDVDRYAKEEAAKEAAKDKKELNRAINEVLYAETLADWREKNRSTQEPLPEEQPAEVCEPVVLPAPAETARPVAIDEEPADISADLADRVERRMDRRVGADDVEDSETDPLDVKAVAYHTAFDAAKNVSADTMDAIELVDDTDGEDETASPAGEPADIAPEVTSELAAELEQSEQALESDEKEVSEAVADIRDSVLSADEEPIELTEESEEEAEEETAAKEEPAEPEVTEDEPEEPAEEPGEEPAEEAAAAFAEVAVEEAEEPEEAEEAEEPDEADEDEEADEADEADEDGEDVEDELGAEPEEAPASFGGQRIVYIDAKANPEAYAELLEREKRGEVTLVYRYRKSFLSKMAMADESVKTYYNEVKNALLAYKGVKCRTSWGYEAFNKGRIKIARMDVKTKSLSLYLAIDPASLADTKYTFKDMSEKKKYAATPVLMKIRGERKFKHALELIEKICGESLQLKHLELEPVDYRLPMMSQDEMVEAGYMKMMVGAIPTQPEEPAEPAAEPVEEPTEEAAAVETNADAAATSVDTSADTSADSTEGNESSSGI